jgi:phage shock protein C
MDKKLYKSDSNKVIAGVCAGIGEFFNIDATLVRLGWVLFALLGGSGLLAYLICALIIPKKTENY